MRKSIITAAGPARGLSRRGMLATGAAAAGLLATPNLIRAQAREIVIGGAAPDSAWINAEFIPKFEKKLNCKVLFEGARATVNLEKLRANKARPSFTVVFMDESTMSAAMGDDLLEKIDVGAVPALGKLHDGAIRQGGMWAAFLRHWTGISVNTKKMPKDPLSWASLWDPKYKGQIGIPSLQLTDGIHVFQAAASLESGKPPEQALLDTEAGFAKLRKLKPNLMTAYSNLPQAFNLVEQGEVDLFVSFSSYVLGRKAAGAPVDLLPPKEGVYIVPQTVGLVKGGPNKDIGLAAINEFLSEEIQAFASARGGSLPANKLVAAPKTLPADVKVFGTDWDYVTKNRAMLIARFDRDMQI